jgi:phosphorylated CTD-interacting factor 1
MSSAVANKRLREEEDGNHLNSDTFAEMEYLECLRCVDAELYRSRLAYKMSKSLGEICQQHGIDDMSLFVGFVFETVAARSTLEPSTVSRKWLHPQLDTGRRRLVRRIHESGDSHEEAAAARNDWELATVVNIKFFNGEILGVCEVSDSDGDSTSSDRVRIEEVPISKLELVEPIPLYLDPMLPCGEIVRPHKSPQSVYHLALGKLCEADKTKQQTFNSKKKTAWKIADSATVLAFEAREAMAAYAPKPIKRRVLVTFHSNSPYGESEARIRIENVDDKAEQFPFSVQHELVAWQYQKLRRFYNMTQLRRGKPAVDEDDNNSARAEESAGVMMMNAPVVSREQFQERNFHLRLFTMLQRYTGVTGLFSRIEAGWHAAVPPDPFDYLQGVMGAEAECFASPLNCRMPRFCSAFVDTDAYFGSHGSFMGFSPVKGCFEVGPPYDHEVMRIAFEHALALTHAQSTSSDPLCFVFIIPESARDSGLKVRANVDKSPYNRVSEVLPKERAKYVDGFQHRAGENRLIIISCDTRIIFVMNDAGVARWPPHEHFQQIKNLWLNCTRVISSS